MVKKIGRVHVALKLALEILEMRHLIVVQRTLNMERMSLMMLKNTCGFYQHVHITTTQKA